MHTQAHKRPSHEQPDSTELNFEQLEVVSGGLMATVIANLANMRHESA